MSNDKMTPLEAAMRAFQSQIALEQAFGKGSIEQDRAALPIAIRAFMEALSINNVDTFMKAWMDYKSKHPYGEPDGDIFLAGRESLRREIEENLK